MSKYLAATSLRRAIARLSSSKVRMGSLLDFLVVKRAFVLAGHQGVAMATSEPSFKQALGDIAGLAEFNGEPVRPGKPYFNPFTANDSNLGYRSSKFASNGTNTNIGKNLWNRVVALDDSKPRLASLTADYDQHLASLLLVQADVPLPRLADVAMWYFRAADIEPLIGEELDGTIVSNLLAEELRSRLDLTAGEIDSLFDTSPDLDSEDCIVEEEQAVPSEYLPGFEASASTSTDDEMPGQISLNLVTAIAAKNFVILTGPSGTGKSRAALILTAALQRHFGAAYAGDLYELVPVGPDWTSPKRLLGFRSPFGPERKGADEAATNDTYELTTTLRLILRAHHPTAAEVPHFLLFDEMNLSHVERYFAPFLSLMEAGGILGHGAGLSLIDDDSLDVLNDVLQALDSSSLEAESAAMMIAEGRTLTLPPNLFFVGTVNVDETTYMFSPKVLDRAHVIELESVRPGQYLGSQDLAVAEPIVSVHHSTEILQEAVRQQAAGAFNRLHVSAILDQLTDDGFQQIDVDALKEFAALALNGCYDLLGPIGFAFGYRVSKEVLTYVRWWCVARKIAGESVADIVAGLPDALDRAVLQKVLPKLHGNRRVLGDSLKALSAFLAGNHAGSSPPVSYSLGIGNQVAVPASGALRFAGASVALPLSSAKVMSMHNRLVATGYVSFVS